MTDRYLIVGLGNPGREYADTRHNVGFQCVDALAATHRLTFNKVQAKAILADGLIGDRQVTLAKPQTYMNLSGESVSALMNFYKLTPDALIVISDDLDIPLGTLRIRITGSAGGQNGLKNIIQHLGTQDFARIRIGIGRPPGRMDAAAYVLQAFGKDERALADDAIQRATAAIGTWLTDGIAIAMTRYNGTGEPAKPPSPPKPRISQAPSIDG